ncbi:hypothetical protein HYT92_03800 [Candidatus Pacearchaeota archaeon]|nr:hypothetical protein [Candidatus Pacearchaeota archaeon]
MEIMGLAVVVLIILVAMVISVRFLVFKKTDNARQGFVSAELASNTINTFLKTTAAECSKAKMEELIQDCAQGTERICSNGEGACEFVENAAGEIFSRTFDKWKTKYRFMIFIDPSTPFVNLESQCTDKHEKESETFFVPVNAGAVSVKLDICK